MFYYTKYLVPRNVSSHLQKQLPNVWDFNDARRTLNDYQMSWKFTAWLKTNVLGSAVKNINVLIKMVYERAKNVTKIEQFLKTFYTFT